MSAAVALANLDIFEREKLNEHVLANTDAFRHTLEKLTDLPIVGDVRGDGFFFGIEMVKDKNTRETFDDDESERLLRGFLSKALFDAGLYCRADDRGDPVIQLSPPLICDQSPLRRDGADPALGADRGMVAPLGRTAVRRLPEKQVHERAGLDAVLDAGLVAHVAVPGEDGQPFVIPVAYARDGDSVLFHGSTASRLFRSWPRARRPASPSRCSTAWCSPGRCSSRRCTTGPRWCSASPRSSTATRRCAGWSGSPST